MLHLFLGGSDIAIIPNQEVVSGHEVIYGHATTGERRMPVPAEYKAAKTVTIPAEFETITAKSQSDTSESKEVIPAEFDTSNK
jgi:BRCT domain type II-containing protein